MIKKLTDNLSIETEVPLKNVTRFWFSWKINCHATFKLEGCIDGNIEWDCCQSYNNQIKLWMDDNGNSQTIFFGNITSLETTVEGGVKQAFVEALSASCVLDRQNSSCSFQNIEKTFGEVVKEAAESEGGHVICNRQADGAIEEPVIRYQETVWQFARRLANQTGTFIIPDVVTGRANFWFGMRKGKEVPSPLMEEYKIDIFPLGLRAEVRYQIEGRIPYNIGDTLLYLKRKLTVTELEGRFEHGELIFKHRLEDLNTMPTHKQEYYKNAGLGLWGTVREVKGESVKLALDIDGGEDTGDYFYPWQPDTGNSLYAMPESGTKALLYFYHADLKKGAVIHCINKELKSKHNYKNRFLEIEDGNQIRLWAREVSLKRGKKHSMAISNSCISAKTRKKLEISASGSVYLRGRKIVLKTPEELNISQA